MKAESVERAIKKWDVSLFFLLAGLLLPITGCATLALHRSRDNFYMGKVVEAETRIETIRRVRGKNSVLLLIERGLIYQTNEKYEKSNQDLLKAAEEIEQLETIRIPQQASSFLSSDVLLSYTGEPFEKVLVHTYSAINFIKLNKWEDALVECKRALKKLSRSPIPDKQPFTNYLAGICYEIMGEYDDARIEYEKVHKARPEIVFVKSDIKRIMHGSKIPNKGELICLIQTGKSPIKHSVEWFIPPDKRFVVPEYHRRRYPSRKATVVVSRVYASPTEDAKQERVVKSCEAYVFTDLEALATETLAERMGREIAREIARLAMKEKVAKEIEKETSEAMGNLLRIGFLLSESADTRSWQTLPAKLAVARLSLDPGTYDVRIRFLSGNEALLEERVFEKVGVEPGRKVFLISRSLL